MKRKRKWHLLIVLLIISAGLVSRASFIPKVFYPFLGDVLYAMMVYFITGFIFLGLNAKKVALISLIICILIELSQLNQAPWINALRAYKLGGLILGYGFLWSDLLMYTIGCTICYLLENIFLVKKHQ